ncbi:synaptotagmin III [Roseibium sp. TrichSKD4]|nr:synaptotagmin III [Roseibium sp. TrichSKD4]
MGSPFLYVTLGPGPINLLEMAQQSDRPAKALWRDTDAACYAA